jgi:hypothetical protein
MITAYFPTIGHIPSKNCCVQPEIRIQSHPTFFQMKVKLMSLVVFITLICKKIRKMTSRQSTMITPTFLCSVENFISYGVTGLVDPDNGDMTKNKVILGVHL